jgi:hypothetical protein
MAKTTKHQRRLLLDHLKAALLDELVAETRIAKQVLLREAGRRLVDEAKEGGTGRVVCGRRRAVPLQPAWAAIAAYAVVLSTSSTVRST